MVLHFPLGITPSQEKTAKRKLSMIEEGPEGTGCETNKTARKFMSRSITTGKIPMVITFLIITDNFER